MNKRKRLSIYFIFKSPNNMNKRFFVTSRLTEIERINIALIQILESR